MEFIKYELDGGFPAFAFKDYFEQICEISQGTCVDPRVIHINTDEGMITLSCEQVKQLLPFLNELGNTHDFDMNKLKSESDG